MLNLLHVLVLYSVRVNRSVCLQVHRVGRMLVANLVILTKFGKKASAVLQHISYLIHIKFRYIKIH